MRKDNTQNYQTPNSRIQHFSDFTDNVGAEKDELNKVKRSFLDNEDRVHNLPNVTKMKYNKVTNKMDNLSKDEVTDKIKSLEDDGVKKSDHKFKIVDDEVNPNHKFSNETGVKESKLNETRYDLSNQGSIFRELSDKEKEFATDVLSLLTDRSDFKDLFIDGFNLHTLEKVFRDITKGRYGISHIIKQHIIWDPVKLSNAIFGLIKKHNETMKESRFIKSFEAFIAGVVDNPQIPQLNKTTEPLSGSDDEVDDYEGQEDEYEYDDEQVDKVEFNSDSEQKSYMFFGNIETIHRQACELCELDENMVNSLLNEGHNWAEDHISVSKELLSQVHNFLMNKGIKEHLEVSGVEHDGGENYMFFANLETICRLSSEISEMDKDVIDELLENGHDWAEDHIAAAKEDVQQVYEFLKTETK